RSSALFLPEYRRVPWCTSCRCIHSSRSQFWSPIHPNRKPPIDEVADAGGGEFGPCGTLGERFRRPRHRGASCNAACSRSSHRSTCTHPSHSSFRRTWISIELAKGAIAGAPDLTRSVECSLCHGIWFSRACSERLADRTERLGKRCTLVPGEKHSAQVMADRQSAKGRTYRFQQPGDGAKGEGARER